MIAAQLVTALLDAEEDPKFFKRIMPRSSLPRIEDVDFELDITPEQEAPEDHFQFPEDIAFARHEIENGNVWGWCTVHLIARWTTLDGKEVTGEDWLGACSYHSEEDFKEPGGYYDSMKDFAYNELLKELKKMGYQ